MRDKQIEDKFNKFNWSESERKTYLLVILQNSLFIELVINYFECERVGSDMGPDST